MTNHSALRCFLETSAFDAADARLVGAIARAAASVGKTLSAARAEPLPEGEPSALLTNVHGEVVHPLEVAASDAFVGELSKEPCCGGLLGKSFGVPLDFRSHGPDRFVCFNALDNPSELANGGPMGATFGILPWAGTAAESALLPGNELLAAGLVLYSAPLTLVLASPRRADLFEWSEEAEDFVLRRADLRCPMPGPSNSNFESGGLVSDAYRALIDGGLFIHLADSGAEAGALRLINEANPLAFVFRAASGGATFGTASPLEVRPASYSETTPFVAGSYDEVTSFERRWGVSRGLSRRPA